MDKFPVEEFKRDYIIKTLVQETQFEQWLKLFFFLNNELSEKYDFVYQDAFYTKLHQLFTGGFLYANKVLNALEKGNNDRKRSWYLKLIEGLDKIKTELSEAEFEYIEYRRHNACHIFQNSYEHIQENLRIKKERNGKKLQDILKGIQVLILKHGSDRGIDKYINEKLQPKIIELYKRLI